MKDVGRGRSSAMLSRVINGHVHPVSVSERIVCLQPLVMIEPTWAVVNSRVSKECYTSIILTAVATMTTITKLALRSSSSYKVLPHKRKNPIVLVLGPSVHHHFRKKLIARMS